jgi:hypothetical protein
MQIHFVLANKKTADQAADALRAMLSCAKADCARVVAETVCPVRTEKPVRAEACCSLVKSSSEVFERNGVGSYGQG